MTYTPTDPVSVTVDLVRCASVTPEEGGALGVLDKLLTQAGFSCHRIDRGGISNLFARWGDKGSERTFGFNGHTDVVPVGDVLDWSVDPFGAEIRDGFLWGRGASDMKSGVAAFVAAAIDFVTETPPDGSVILTITGDEEADATDGTVAILDWMDKQDENMSVCLVGEPTCPNHMGEALKIGRRGSMVAFIAATGIQGHSAYPHRANNPVPVMARLIVRLSDKKLDSGTEHFDPSLLAATTFDTGNLATNVIPASCKATVNIRFNDEHTSSELTTWLQEEADALGKETRITFEITTKVSGESFLTPPGPLSDLVANAVQIETNRTPELSTSGGTSDARFVRDHCPVVEFGLVPIAIHGVDECVEIAQIHQLKDIYSRILRDYFA
ncbi:MAG: succinyl-diaminopimelate desuccinylase [Paracoccaceae bacterium]